MQHPALSVTALEMIRAARGLDYSIARRGHGFVALDLLTGCGMGPLPVVDESLRGLVFGILSAQARMALDDQASLRLGAFLPQCVVAMRELLEIECMANRGTRAAQVLIEIGMCVSASSDSFYVTDPFAPELEAIPTSDPAEFLFGLIVGAQMQLSRDKLPLYSERSGRRRRRGEQH
jgi:hypothetical protein